MMATKNVPDHVIRQMLASAIQIVVHCARLSDGTRKFTSISEVVGVEDDQVDMQDIFLLERTGIGPRGNITGRFKATGVRPKVLERLKSYGVHLPNSIFTELQEIKSADAMPVPRSRRRTPPERVASTFDVDARALRLKRIALLRPHCTRSFASGACPAEPRPQEAYSNPQLLTTPRRHPKHVPLPLLPDLHRRPGRRRLLRLARSRRAGPGTASQPPPRTPRLRRRTHPRRHRPGPPRTAWIPRLPRRLRFLARHPPPPATLHRSGKLEIPSRRSIRALRDHRRNRLHPPGLRRPEPADPPVRPGPRLRRAPRRLHLPASAIAACTNSKKCCPTPSTSSTAR